MVPDHTNGAHPQFLGVECQMAIRCGCVGPEPGPLRLLVTLQVFQRTPRH